MYNTKADDKYLALYVHTCILLYKCVYEHVRLRARAFVALCVNARVDVYSCVCMCVCEKQNISVCMHESAYPCSTVSSE